MQRVQKLVSSIKIEYLVNVEKYLESLMSSGFKKWLEQPTKVNF